MDDKSTLRNILYFFAIIGIVVLGLLIGAYLY